MTLWQRLGFQAAPSSAVLQSQIDRLTQRAAHLEAEMQRTSEELPRAAMGDDGKALDKLTLTRVRIDESMKANRETLTELRQAHAHALEAEKLQALKALREPLGHFTHETAKRAARLLQALDTFTACANDLVPELPESLQELVDDKVLDALQSAKAHIPVQRFLDRAIDRQTCGEFITGNNRRVNNTLSGNLEARIAELQQRVKDYEPEPVQPQIEDKSGKAPVKA